MKKFFTPVLLALFCFVAGCSNDDENSGNGNDPDPITFTKATGYYYGDKYENNTGNFLLTLESASGNLQINCFSALLSDDNIALPRGIYEFTTEADIKALTFITGSGDQRTFFQSGDATRTITGGSFTVGTSGENTTIAINFTDSDSKKLEGSFTGTVRIDYEPVIPAIKLPEIFGYYLGDEYDTGTTNNIVHFYDGYLNYRDLTFEGDFDDIVLDFFNNWYYGNDIEIETGTYTLDKDFASNGTPLTFIPGYIQNQTFHGTYFQSRKTVNGEEVYQLFLIDSGTFTVTKEGSRYTVVTNFSGYNAYDETERLDNICYSYTGSILPTDFTMVGPREPFVKPDNFEWAELRYYYDRDYPGLGTYVISLSTQKQDNVAPRYRMLRIQVRAGDVNYDPENLMEHFDVRLPEGTYNVATADNEPFSITATHVHPENGGAMSTFYYETSRTNYDVEKVDRVVSGTMTVRYIGEYIRIDTDFDFIDHDTGETVEKTNYFFYGSALGFAVPKEPFTVVPTFKTCKLILGTNGYYYKDEGSDIQKRATTFSFRFEGDRYPAYTEYPPEDGRIFGYSTGLRIADLPLGQGYVESGTYTMDETMMGKPFHTYPGISGGSSDDYKWSFYRSLYKEYYQNAILYEEGELRVQRNSLTNYTLELDFYGPDNRSEQYAYVKGTWSGEVELSDEREEFNDW